MKTTDILQRQINNAIATGEKTVDPRERKKLGNELAFLKDCLLYLESNPSEEYLKHQLALLEKKCRVLNEGYYTWLNSTPNAKNLKSPRSAFETSTDIKTYKKQIETLKFLLT